MSYNIGFYIHHHGSGHLMRALAIAAHLDRPITFLGSGMRDYQTVIPPSIRCIHLPADVPDEDDHAYVAGTAVDCLHYAPLNVTGIRLRNQLLSDFFAATYPIILIVDVSVEVALFARLSGIPSIVMRQHGSRNDTAHLAAYQSASLLLAPYPERLRTGSIKWVDEKTFFAGGFSRYTGLKKTALTIGDDKCVAVITGRGGTSISLSFIRHIARVCPEHHFHILGDIATQNWSSGNVSFHGRCAEPETVLNICRIVIGNAGHNTVMEVADLQKAFICIPEKRPFEEQLQKALLIQRHFAIPLVMPEALFKTDWQDILDKLSRSQPEWQGIINEQALSQVAAAIDQLAIQLFGSP
ncbi:glycosyltransferase [Mucilaginibacter terrae]|uniref:glycosyltransferase n=1 Tax=Mucilaginibacter terrae TaxID=1955052 RepID=UPI0036347B97